MQKVNTIIVICLLFIFLLTLSARAELIDRGGGLIYDTDFNVTWLQDANFAKTSGADTDGMMTWYEAMSWANNLIYQGYSDWRLPTAYNRNGSGPCEGYWCTENEFGHLYFIEGIGDPSPFINVQFNRYTPNNSYWMGTEAPNHTDAYQFNVWGGSLTGVALQSNPFYSWAVRNGDSTPLSVVPEPISFILFVVGGTLLAGQKLLRRKV